MPPPAITAALLQAGGDGEPPRRALTFVADPTNPPCAGPLRRDAVAAVLAHSDGRQGIAEVYRLDTTAELRRQGLPDITLDRLAADVAARRAA